MKQFGPWPEHFTLHTNQCEDGRYNQNNDLANAPVPDLTCEHKPLHPSRPAVRIFPTSPKTEVCIVASTIITAPSTINPKSIAQGSSGYPTPRKHSSSQRRKHRQGMTEATIRPAADCPATDHTKITMSAPSARFLDTVLMDFVNKLCAIQKRIDCNADG